MIQVLAGIIMQLYPNVSYNVVVVWFFMVCSKDNELDIRIYDRQYRSCMSVYIT